MTHEVEMLLEADSIDLFKAAERRVRASAVHTFGSHYRLFIAAALREMAEEERREQKMCKMEQEIQDLENTIATISDICRGQDPATKGNKLGDIIRLLKL